MTPEAYRPVSYLEWNAARRPRAAAVWDGRDISFEELLAHVRSFQRWLAAQRVVAGDVVGVRLPNVWQYVALELAIPDLGAVILPLPLTLGEHEMRWVTERTRPRLVIGEQPSPVEGAEPRRAEADRHRARRTGYRDGRRAHECHPHAEPRCFAASGARGRGRGRALAAGDRRAVGAFDGDSDLQLLRVHGRGPAGGRQPVRPAREALDHRGQAA